MISNPTFQNMADAHQIDRFLMENAADMIAVFHQNAAQINASEFDLSTLSIEMRAAIKQRLGSGCFRQCHGDLRLVNLSRIDDQTVFSQQKLTTLDIVQDLAVLLCDLDENDLRPQLNILFNRYFDVTGGCIDDPETLSVLTYYMSKKQSISSSKQPIKLIAVGGLSGGGKSRMSRELGPLFDCSAGARIVRTDVVRKRMMGVPLSERLLSHGYTDEMNQRTYDLFYKELEIAIEQGYPVIADAVFALPEQRAGVEALADKLGVEFCGLWVTAPADVRARRVKQRKNNVSDITEAVIQRQLSYDIGNVSWNHIDSSGPKAETLAKGREYLAL